MKVFTSSYSKYRGALGVPISRTFPKDNKYSKVMQYVAPEWEDVFDIKSGNTKLSEYRDEYFEMLDSIEDTILNDIEDGDVFLCWCGNYYKCHRSLFAEWLENHGIECEEVTFHEDIPLW